MRLHEFMATRTVESANLVPAEKAIVLGAKIELVTGDSQSKPEAAVAEVDKLSEQGIACFLGGYASGIALTATQASARNKVPFMVDGPVSD